MSDFNDIDSIAKKRQWISQYKYAKPFLIDKKDYLEIGSGAGQELFWFEEMGFNVTGIDPDQRSVNNINQKLKRGHCIVGFAEDMEIKNKFDIVWISHAFEHLIRPDLLLKKCKDILNKSGILFIEVPNCENSVILEESIHRQPSTFHYSKSSLLNLAKKAEFEVKLCDYFRSPTLLEGVINRMMRRFYNSFPYYPRIMSNKRCGTDIRVILENR